MKQLLLFLIASAVISTASAIDLEATFKKLASNEDAVRLEARNALQTAFAKATAPGVDTAGAQQLESAVVGQLTGSLPLAERLYLIRMLETFGSEDVADKIKPLLSSKDINVQDSAIRALASIPGSKARSLLLAGLSQSSDAGKKACINALAQRGDPTTAPDIAKLLLSKNVSVVNHAALALGKLGNPEVKPALTSAMDTAKGTSKTAIELSLLDLGADADLAYRLASSGSNALIRSAAFKQLVAQDEKRASEILQKAIAGADVPGRLNIIREAAENGPKALRDQTVKHMESASDADKQMIVTALGVSGQRQYENQVLAILPQAKDILRRSIIDALGNIGGDASFDALYAEFQGNTRDTNAANALARLKAPSVDQKVMQEAQSATDPAKRAAAINVLMLRNPKGATDVINKILSQPADAKVLEAAMKTSERIGNMESMKHLITYVLGLGDLARPAQLSLKRLSVNLNAGDDLWDKLYLPALTKASSDEARTNLILVLDGNNSPKTLQYLKSKVMEHGALSEVSLKTLARWPSGQVGAVWVEIAADKSATKEEVGAAQKGLVRVLKSSRGSLALGSDSRVKLAVQAIQKAPSVEFKKAVLSALEKPDRRLKSSIKKHIKPLLNDPDVGSKVKQLMK